MSEQRRLAWQSTHYLIAQIAGMAAGLISIPLLTRLLERDDYGYLSLLVLSVNLLTALLRLGIPQSIARHYPEYAGAGERRLQEYVSSLFLFALLVGCASMLILAILGVLVGDTGWRDWSTLIAFGGVLLLSELVSSTLAEIFRAQQRSVAVAVLSIAYRYTALALSLLSFFFIARSLEALLGGKAVGQFAILIIFAVPLVISGLVRLRTIDYRVIREAMTYGLPLSIASTAGFVLEYGDRFLIQFFEGPVQVARYALPYDIVMHMETAVTTPIRMALVPMVFAMMTQRRRADAAALLSQTIKVVVILILPAIVGLALVGTDVVVLLASEKYADSAPLVPLLAIAVLTGGLVFLFNIGLAYQKRTRIIAALTLAAGVINVGLNLILIPLYGVFGAAVATILSYFLLLSVSAALSQRELPVRVDGAGVFRVAIATAVMAFAVLAVGRWSPSGTWLLSIKIPVGVLTYGVVLYLLEPALKRYLRRVIRPRRLVLPPMREK